MKLLILALMLGVPFPIFAENKYQNFSELSKYETICVDYRIGIQDVGSKISILAIHGGLIEPTTTEIAKAIARDEFNYYLFEGIKTDGNWDLHISSSQFDEPQALRLTEKSKTCVSIHGFKEKNKKLACLGGMNERLKELISGRLKETNILDSYAKDVCQRYSASTPTNIVNRCSDHGVQIELSRALRDLLRSSSEKMFIFSEAVRAAVLDYNRIKID